MIRASPVLANSCAGPVSMSGRNSLMCRSEQLKAELAAMNEMSGPVFKVTNDPRITRFGKFLRRSSVDEWPQFFNVPIGTTQGRTGRDERDEWAGFQGHQ